MHTSTFCLLPRGSCTSSVFVVCCHSNTDFFGKVYWKPNIILLPLSALFFCALKIFLVVIFLLGRRGNAQILKIIGGANTQVQNGSGSDWMKKQTFAFKVDQGNSSSIKHTHYARFLILLLYTSFYK